MKKFVVLAIIIVTVICAAFVSRTERPYFDFYSNSLNTFCEKQRALLKAIDNCDLSSEKGRAALRKQIEQVRLTLKENDFWLRYLEPVLYKKINGPLPVEWETEVFEKFEKPYKRTGAGL